MLPRSSVHAPVRPAAALLFLVASLLALLAPAAHAQTAAASNALALALDAPSLSFTSTGAGAWFSQTAVTRDGVDAVQSGPTAASAKSTLSVTVTGITKFSFRWKVSSESNRDLLTFYINNVAQPAPISGNVDWQTRTYTLSGTGSHTLAWEYAKDATVSSYSDAGWVDQFTVLEATVPYITSHPANVTIQSGANAALSIATLEGSFTYQWYQGDAGSVANPVPGATGPTLLTPPLRANARYWVRVTQSGQTSVTADSQVATVTVSPGRTHSLLSAGTSAEGALGLGETTASPTPAKAQIAVLSAAAGPRHSLFLKTDGSLWAMGDNSSGQLGDGTEIDRPAPVAALVDDLVVQIAAGASHSLFVKSDGSLWGMGSNAQGQLGATAPATSSSPVKIASAASQFVTDVVQVAAAENHTLFLKTNGSLWALGSHRFKTGTPPVAASTPLQIDTGVAFVATGKAHTLYVKTDGSLWAWGENGSGQLGDGTTTERDDRVAIATRVIHAAAGGDHSLFVRSDGSLWAMGSHAKGQLGAGSLVVGSSAQPVQITSGAARVAAGESHSLFLKTDGSLWAMGANEAGQLGDGGSTDQGAPVSVASDIVGLSAGSTHSLLLQTPPSHVVTFVLGEGARRTGGGALVQTVREGEAAVPPTFVPPSGKALQQWSADFSQVTGPLTVSAEYLEVQTITFAQPPKQTLTPPSGSLDLVASSSSGLPVTFEIVSGPATIEGSTLTFTAAGNVVVRAVCASGQVGDTVYATAKLERTIVIAPAQQVVSFAPPATATYGDEPITLSASTTAPELPITFALVSGPATLSGSTLTLTGAGNVVVSASQAGNDSYASASKSATIKVGKKPLIVSAPSLRRSVSQPNPVFILNYSGFVEGDTATKPGVIAAAPSLVVGPTPLGAPGAFPEVYPVTLKGGASANYAFELADPAPTLTVFGYGGSYEALVDGAAHDLVPVGKLEITVAARSLQYTGILRLAAESAPISLRGTLVPSPDFSGAAHTFLRAETTTRPALELAFTVTAEGELHGTLERGEAAPVAFADGVRLGAPAALGAGAHTLVLGPGIDAEDTAIIPGRGHASAAIAPKTAVLTLNGKLADGAPLTATLKPAADRSYRLWVNPYKQRVDSFLAGRLELDAHPETARFPGRHYIPAEPVTALFWKKAALPDSTPPAKRDATHRAGFGPLAAAVRLDPWIPPVSTKNALTTVTLARRLGLADDNTASAALTVVHGEDGLDLGALADALPGSLTLSPNGRLSIAAPVTVPANRAAWRILKLNPATGAFNGRFVLRDPPSSGTREIVRTVDFSGTFRQRPAAESDSPVAEGFFLLPALDASSGKSSHAFELLPASE